MQSPPAVSAADAGGPLGVVVAPLSASSVASHSHSHSHSGGGASGTKRRQDSAQLHAQHMQDDDDGDDEEEQGRGRGHGSFRGVASFRLDDSPYGAGPVVPSPAGLGRAHLQTHTRSRSKRLSRAGTGAGAGGGGADGEARFSGMDDLDALALAQAPSSLHPSKTLATATAAAPRLPLQDISNKGATGIRSGDKRILAHVHMRSHSAMLHSSADKKLARLAASFLPVAATSTASLLARDGRPAAVAPAHLTLEELAADEAADSSMLSACCADDQDQEHDQDQEQEHDQEHELEHDDALNASIESSGSACSSLPGVHALRIQHDASYSSHTGTFASAATSFANSSSALSMSMSMSALDCSAFSSHSAAAASIHGAAFSITQQVAALEAGSTSPGGESLAELNNNNCAGSGSCSSVVGRSGGVPAPHKPQALDTPSVLPSAASTLTATMAHALQLEDEDREPRPLARPAIAAAPAVPADSAPAASAAAGITIHPVAYTHPDMQEDGEEEEEEELRLLQHQSQQVEAVAAAAAAAAEGAVPAAAAVAVAVAVAPEAGVIPGATMVAASPGGGGGGGVGDGVADADDVLSSRHDASVLEYSSEIWSVLRSSEGKYLANPRYMEEVQTDLSHLMRSILVDWLIEVAEEYALEAQTLFLCVGYVDRFLSRHPVDRAKLQLLGVAAVLLAAKYWEVRAPTVEDLIYISDRTYSRAQVLAMESVLLDTLGFALVQVTPWDCSARLAAEMGRQILPRRTEFLVEVRHVPSRESGKHTRSLALCARRHCRVYVVVVFLRV